MIKHLTIKTKMYLMFAGLAVVVLSLALLINILYQQQVSKEQLVKEIDGMARLIANRSTASLVFEDTRIAADNLDALGVIDSIKSACIFVEGRVFARFSRDGKAHDCPRLPLSAGAHFGSGSFAYSYDIRLDGEKIGVLHINASLSSAGEAVTDYLLVAALTFVSVSVVGLWMSHRLQRLVTKPITELAITARRISTTRDYSLRAKRMTNDEIADLVDAFNSMLKTLSERNARLESSEARYRELVEGLPGISYTGSLDHDRILYVSPQIEEILGYPATSWIDNAQLYTDSIHPDDRGRVLRDLADSNRGNLTFHGEYRLRHRGGHYIWVEHEARIVGDGNESDRLRRGTLNDVSVRKEHEAVLRQAAAVFSNTREGVIITDTHTRIVDVNEAYTEITGLPKELLLGRVAEVIPQVGSRAELHLEMRESLRDNGSWRGEILDHKANGDTYPAWLSISEVRDDRSALVNYVGVIRDISDIKKTQAQLDYLAHHDPLTGLPNRLMINDRLNHTLRMYRRCLEQQDRTCLAVLFLDLDEFKTINDSLGHAVGDSLLKEVSQRLQQQLRPQDTIARIGGDEFVVVIDEIDEEEYIAYLASRLINGLSLPFHIEGHEIYAVVSIGISRYPFDGRNENDLMKNADAAMYLSKSVGGNTYQFYSEKLTEAAHVAVEMTTSLRRALDEKQFELFFQPKVSLGSKRGSCGETVGLEALIRWKHPERGYISPDDFIPLTEKNGLIIPIGEWVFRESCRQARIWADQHVQFGRIAVNVSGKQLTHPDIVAMFDLIVKETGVAPELIEIEVTESSLMEPSDYMIELLSQLKSRGFSLAIDDFGTGYSSMAYLKRLPVDTLKIDRAFVRDLSSDANDKAICTAILALGQALKLTIVAEGVETEQQERFLQDAGCDVAQGYLYARPSPAEECRPGDRLRPGQVIELTGKQPQPLAFQG